MPPLDRLRPLCERFRVRASLCHAGTLCGLTHFDAQPGRGTVILHPGPMNRGLEISSAAADSPRSTVLEQVSNGVAVRMAVLYLLLSADPQRPGAL